MQQPLYSPKQARVLLEAHSRWNILSGAVRSGKTHISHDLLAMRIVQQGEGNFLLTGKTERTLKRNVLDPMRVRFGNNAVSQVYGDGLVDIFGRTCYVAGANDERSVTKIQGLGLVYGLGDEITTWPRSYFEMLKSRLDKPGAKFDGTCNPESPYHHIKTEMIDKADYLDLSHWHFTIDDNPFLDPAFVKSLKQEYSGLWYKRYILGLWVLAEGAVYDNFDSSRHVVDELPTMEETWLGVDYGTSNATVFILLGMGSDENFYVIDEFYHAGGEGHFSKTDAEYSDTLANFLEGRDPRWIFVDPSAKSFRYQLYRDKDRHDSFAHVTKANNAVLDGIRKVHTLLGLDKLKIHKRCENLIREMTSYSWDPKAQQRGEDKPLKRDDDAVDALRYSLASLSAEYDRVTKAVD